MGKGEYVFNLESAPDRATAEKVFDLVRRFDFAAPGFCLLDAGPGVDSHKLRSWMVALKQRLSEVSVRRAGKPLLFASMGRFDQQVTTKFHLFRAYFTEGRDISDRQALLDVVAEAGLDRNKVEDVLNNDHGMEAIREADELARRFRVEGVPFFVVNGRITLSGAQPPDAFLQAFRQVIAST